MLEPLNRHIDTLTHTDTNTHMGDIHEHHAHTHTTCMNRLECVIEKETKKTRARESHTVTMCDRTKSE